jgi:hypothetical protein
MIEPGRNTGEAQVDLEITTLEIDNWKLEIRNCKLKDQELGTWN